MNELTHSPVRGRLKQAGSAGSGIGVEISTSGNDVRISTGLEVLGVWPSASVEFEHVSPGVFKVAIDGEKWILKTGDPSGLISTLPKRAFSPATRATAAGKDGTKRPRLHPKALRAWGAHQLTMGVRPSVFAPTVAIAFLIGYLFGRSPSRNVVLAVILLAAIVAIVAIVWMRLDRRRLAGSSQFAPRPGKEAPTSAKKPSDQSAEPGVTAKRLAEALERIAATGEARDSESRPSEDTGATLAAEPEGRPVDAAPTPARDGSISDDDNHPRPEDNGATVVFLDAYGRVVGRGNPSGTTDPSVGTEEKAEGIDEAVEFGPPPAPLVTSHLVETGVDSPGTPANRTNAGARTDGDDLELIRGIGPVYAEAFARLGLNTFAAIASLDDNDIRRIEALVGPIRGRMRRYRWREHARALDTPASQSVEGDRDPRQMNDSVDQSEEET